MSFIIDYDDNSIFNYTTEIEWMHILQSKKYYLQFRLGGKKKLKLERLTAKFNHHIICTFFALFLPLRTREERGDERESEREESSDERCRE